MNKVLQIIIRARDATSGAFATVTRRLRAIGRAASDIGKSIAVIGGSAAAAVTGLGLLARRGGEVANVQQAFARVVGDSAAALDQLRAATRGLVPDMDLMTGFNQAIALGSARNVEEFGRMARAAFALSRTLGIDAKFALESLNTGISRQSKLYLDNLGIILDLDAANERYARKRGKQAKDLTELEKREAFRIAALEEAERVVSRLGEGSDNAGDSATRLWNQLKNVGDEIARLVANTPLVEEFFEKLIDGLEWLEGHLPRIVGNLTNLATAAWDAIGLGDPIAREANRRLANIRAGFGDDRSENLARAQVWVQQLEDTQRGAMRRVVELRREARAAGILRADGSISPLALSPTSGARPEVRELARNLEAALQEVQIITQVLMGVQSDVQRFQPTPSDMGGGGAAAAPFAGSLFGPFASARVPLIHRLWTPVNFFGGIGLARQADLAPSVFAGASVSPFVQEPGPELGIFGDFVGQLRLYEPAVEKAGTKTKKAADELERAGATAVAAFGAMAQAAVEGSEITSQSIVHMITDIVRSLPGVGGFAGAVIGAVGGVFGALLSRGSGRSDPVPVRLASVDDQAARKLEPRREGPDRLTVQFIDPRTGQETARIEHDLRRRTRIDAVPRITDGGV